MNPIVPTPLQSLALQFNNRLAHHQKLKALAQNRESHFTDHGVKHYKTLIRHNEFALSNLRSEIIALLWVAV